MLTDLWRILTSPLARKCQVAIIALIVSAAAAGLFPPAVALWINLVVSALSVAGIYVVPNSNNAILEPKKIEPVVTPEAPVVVTAAHRAEPTEIYFNSDAKG
jgi:hypothetical protein